jgi:hypothetical protein
MLKFDSFPFSEWNLNRILIRAYPIDIFSLEREAIACFPHSSWLHSIGQRGEKRLTKGIQQRRSSSSEERKRKRKESLQASERKERNVRTEDKQTEKRKPETAQIQMTTSIPLEKQRCGASKAAARGDNTATGSILTARRMRSRRCR